MGRHKRTKPPRPLVIEGDIAYVPLTQGYVAIIDAADAARVGRWNWAVLNSQSARTMYAFCTRPGNRALHRYIMRCRKGKVVDHINGNGLDNRRANLRIVTHRENQLNRYYHREPDGYGRQVVIRFSDEEVRRLDAVMGRTGRMDFMREAVLRAIRELSEAQGSAA